MKAMVRFRPFMATAAAVMVSAASHELNWHGYADRLIQFTLAYIAFAFVFPDKPNTSVRGAAAATGDAYPGQLCSDQNGGNKCARS